MTTKKKRSKTTKAAKLDLKKVVQALAYVTNAAEAAKCQAQFEHGNDSQWEYLRLQTMKERAFYSANALNLFTDAFVQTCICKSCLQDSYILWCELGDVYFPLDVESAGTWRTSNNSPTASEMSNPGLESDMSPEEHEQELSRLNDCVQFPENELALKEIPLRLGVMRFAEPRPRIVETLSPKMKATIELELDTIRKYLEHFEIHGADEHEYGHVLDMLFRLRKEYPFTSLQYMTLENLLDRFEDLAA